VSRKTNPPSPRNKWAFGAPFLWAKWPGCETDHSPPSNAKLNKTVLRPARATTKISLVVPRQPLAVPVRWGFLGKKRDLLPEPAY